MSTAALQSTVDEEPRRVAPIWHTIVYFGLLVALTYWLYLAKPGAHKPSLPSTRVNPLWAYVIGFMLDGILLGLMYLGLRISKTRLSELMGPGWADRSQVRRDVIVGTLFSLVLLAVSLLILVSFPSHRHNDDFLEFLPRTLPQFLLFFALLTSAGFFEELIFRGYLLRQLNHFVGINSAIVIQAVVFAALHGFDQSVGGTVDKFVAGGFLGLLAVQRKSLLPGMIAHGCLNGIAAAALGLSQILR
ncbi:MAG TPA: CPBP family intramembrane glutamic endopeptidase [Candidatus Angelobacter sp.]|nr:CPBP family intramembrane glutamic endopeptidase [Candidatus Angelobacter sp.]